MLKFLCNSLFPQTMGMVKPSSSRQVQCPHHPKLAITSFCLKDDCSSPSICSKCKSEHPKSHSRHFVSIQDIYNTEFAKFSEKKFGNQLSVDQIETSHREVLGILSKMEEDVLKSVRELKRNADDYFMNLINTVKTFSQTQTNYSELASVSHSRSEVDSSHIKQLVDNYKNLRQSVKYFEVSPQVVPSNLQREAEIVSSKFKFELLSKLTAALDLKPVNFSKLKVNTTYTIPASEGVLYEACAYIPKWKALAVGFRKNQQGSLSLYSLENHELLSSTFNVHKRWINHVIWIEKWNCIVTCSNDTRIKVFSVSDEGKTMKALTTFRGHTNLVRCIKYLDQHDLLVSAGDDPNIKVWSMKDLKRYATISTNGETNMDGSIAYIPQDNLVGVGFRSGVIKFYNIYSRTVAFEFKTGYENFYTYGLQYLPKRKLILGRVKENVIKLWKYDDEKKKVEQYKTIQAKGNYPDCIVANEDESQLLFTSRDSFLEMYDFAGDKTVQHNLQNTIKKTNALLFLDKMGKVSVCDYTSGKICVLG